MRRAFPLDMIEVATPCHASWDAMTGDDRSRFCGACQRHVYNLSGMTRAEAEALIQEKEGQLCVRLYRLDNWKVMTSDCPVGLAALRRQAVRTVGVVVGAVVGIVGSFFLIPALFGENRGSAKLRQVEPFASVLNWVDPAPPRSCVMGVMIPAWGNGGVGPQQPEPPANETP